MGAETHHQQAGRRPVTAAVITVSDTRTPETDKSGALMRDLLEQAGHRVTFSTIVKDDPAAVRAHLERLAADQTAQVILFNGGTGISRRDTTYEAITGMLEKCLDGFGELFRMLSYAEVGAAAMLSRATAGVYRGVLVFSTPGSTGAVRLAMEKLILPELAHLVWELSR
jgi:molybdenum cofactor biosynthesis protein B